MRGRRPLQTAKADNVRETKRETIQKEEKNQVVGGLETQGEVVGKGTYYKHILIHSCNNTIMNPIIVYANRNLLEVGKL